MRIPRVFSGSLPALGSSWEHFSLKMYQKFLKNYVKSQRKICKEQGTHIMFRGNPALRCVVLFCGVLRCVVLCCACLCYRAVLKRVFGPWVGGNGRKAFSIFLLMKIKVFVRNGCKTQKLRFWCLAARLKLCNCMQVACNVVRTC